MIGKGRNRRTGLALEVTNLALKKGWSYLVELRHFLKSMLFLTLRQPLPKLALIGIRYD